MSRWLIGCAALGSVGYYFAGAGDYQRIVDRPPAEVAAAIADLDIRKSPGEPGTDPSRSGGTLPTFAVEQASDHVSYIVTAHGEVATTMTAWLEPVDGGTRTKVTISVKRGPAPDDYVSPAFRSTGITSGLFTMMLEEELDALVFPVGEWDAECDAIVARFEGSNRANGFDQPAPNLVQAMGQTAKMTAQLGMVDKELKAAGCPVKRVGEFEEVRDTLSDGGGSSAPAPPPMTTDPRL